MLSKGTNYLLGNVDCCIHKIFIPMMLLVILFGKALLLYTPSALAQEQERYESEIKEEYLQQLQPRIWQLERRIEEKPQDIKAKEDLKKLREEKIELQRNLIEEDIRRNERQQAEARANMEHLRLHLGKDPDAQHALGEQERWLPELEKERQSLQDELEHLESKGD